MEESNSVENNKEKKRVGQGYKIKYIQIGLVQENVVQEK